MTNALSFTLPLLPSCLRSTCRARLCAASAAVSGDSTTTSPASPSATGTVARLPSLDDIDVADGLADGDRWSTWDQSTPTERGPRPHPDWLVTELAATDTELGILKTGKEADVFLLRRGVPGTDRSCLLAAKRYRSAEHRLFHRDSEYLEGRRVRESRASRAMASRSAVGREMIAEQWAQRGVLRAVPVPPGRRARAVPGAGTRHRGPAGVHRHGRRHSRAAAGRVRAARRRAGRTVGSARARRWQRWPGSGWRTATCRPTTCSCTAASSS